MANTRFAVFVTLNLLYADIWQANAGSDYFLFWYLWERRTVTDYIPIPPSPCLLERRSVGSFSQSFSKSHVIYLRQCALLLWLLPGALLPHQLELLVAEKHCSEARLPDWRLYDRRFLLKFECDFYCALKLWVLPLKSSNIDNRKIDQ